MDSPMGERDRQMIHGLALGWRVEIVPASSGSVAIRSDQGASVYPDWEKNAAGGIVRNASSKTGHNSYQSRDFEFG